MLDFFFRHYDQWIDHYFFHDDGSTDGTREYLERRRNVTVQTLLRSDPDSFVLSAKRTYDTSWKRSRGDADWVVVTNLDEHLYHPGMPKYLGACTAKGITAIPALGYQMITRDWPKPSAVLSRDHPLGVPWRQMSKMQIFNPKHIAETNFEPGRHRCAMVGTVRLPERDEVLNLHYKYLGIDYVSGQHQCARSRLGATDLEQGYGHKYSWDEAKLRAEFEQLHAARIDVHAASYPAPRWWR